MKPGASKKDVMLALLELAKDMARRGGSGFYAAQQIAEHVRDMAREHYGKEDIFA